jgi:hypothetical protein
VLWLGVVLGLLAPVLYVVQLNVGRLSKPWYLPILGTVAAGLALYAVWQRRGVARILAAGFLILLAAGEWAMFSAAKLPVYDGPVAVGQPFPAFATTLADGSPFTAADLAGPRATAMVFFRGRW